MVVLLRVDAAEGGGKSLFPQDALLPERAVERGQGARILHGRATLPLIPVNGEEAPNS